MPEQSARHALRAAKIGDRSTNDNSPAVSSKRESPISKNLCSTGEKPLIFIIDDNPLDVMMMKRALSKANIAAELEIAEDGEQAVLLYDRIQQDPSRRCPDLVLLDINMPAMNGLDVLKHIRSRGRCHKAQVIMVTTSDLPEEREVMADFDAHYFQKPLDADEYMTLGTTAQTLLNQ